MGVYVKNIGNCAYCGSEFIKRSSKKRPGKFCSIGCQRKGRNFKETILVFGKCLTCKKQFTQPKHWKSPCKYCSIPCMAEARGKNMRGKNHPNWKGGDERIGSVAICRKLKKEIGKCQRCGSKDQLHAHHKIKVKERPDLACDPTNIEIICAKCHAKEHPEYRGMLLRKRSGSYLNCQVCDKKFYVKKSKAARAKYCGMECSLTRTSIALRHSHTFRSYDAME